MPTPHVTVRQVLGAPITVRKLTPEKDGPERRALQAIRRYVLQRWIETGRGKTLLVVQERGRTAARTDAQHPCPALQRPGRLGPVQGRPAAHYGRPDVAEALRRRGCGRRLSGNKPAKAPIQANGGTWYKRVERGNSAQGWHRGLPCCATGTPTRWPRRCAGRRAKPSSSRRSAGDAEVNRRARDAARHRHRHRRRSAGDGRPGDRVEGARP